MLRIYTNIKALSSLMCGVSGGIEPLFATSYTRRTESLHGESVSYKVYDPTVLEIMKELITL
jgi:ribonucleoside-diphosphate reductase alpha chain